jgi:nitroreductase
LAPSAGNEQPWKFIIITNKDLIYRISCESKKNTLARIESTPIDYAKKYEKILRKDSSNVFYNAAVLVFIRAKNKLSAIQ